MSQTIVNRQEYAPADVTIKQMDRMCDRKVNQIEKYTAEDVSKDTLNIAAGIIALLAILLLLSGLIRKK